MSSAAAPTAAVFPLAAEGAKLDDAVLDAATSSVATTLMRSGRYLVFPPSSVRTRRADLAKACGAMSCTPTPVEVARSLGADRRVAGTISRTGGRCEVRLEVLAFEASKPEATGWGRGACTTDGVGVAVDAALRKLLWGHTRTPRAVKPKMITVPAGEVEMGCNESIDDECLDDEKPARRVKVGAFRLDRTEVTVAAYRACVIAGACSAHRLDVPLWRGDLRPDSAWACTWDKPGHERHPINCIDWSRAAAYCAWLGKRLPTQREWARAARGGDGRKYPWGNASFGAKKVANISDESAKGKNHFTSDTYIDGYPGTAPVGRFVAGAGPFGGLDLVGNVAEWTADLEGGQRVVRGGSYQSTERYARASSRLTVDPTSLDPGVGFRCAQDL